MARSATPPSVRPLAAAERARLARVVHDGVLQVLALVQRRGAEIGGEATELARLAGEQEAALRTLIRAAGLGALRVVERASTWRPTLAALEPRAGVTVATPGVPVECSTRHRSDGAGRRGRAPASTT